MNRLEEIKNEYAQSEQYGSIEELFGYLIFEKGGLHRVINIIAQKYAEECVKASLEKASEKAIAHLEEDKGGEDIPVVSKGTITNIENIVLL